VARRTIRHRLLKAHRSYTVEELARLLLTHKNTIRNWIKCGGLPVIDDRRPTLIKGSELIGFLKARRTSAKKPCGPGFLFCLKCRSPREPAAGMADYLPLTSTSGNLSGLCPDCFTLMFRRVALSKLDRVRGNLAVAFPEAMPRLIESPSLSLNCDSCTKGKINENA
jgi:excisionase family DNA binding protein